MSRMDGIPQPHARNTFILVILFILSISKSFCFG